MKKSFIGLILFLLLISSCSKEMIVTETVSTLSTTLYQCHDSEPVECLGGLSGGLGTRCYTLDKSGWDYCSGGWNEYKEIVIEESLIRTWCGEYKCYEEKDYCRYKGLIDYPKVKRNEVCV